MSKEQSSLKSYLPTPDPASVSSFVIVANFELSRSKKTVKIVNLQGKVVGISNCNEVLNLIHGHVDHVNIVLYRTDQQRTLGIKSADPEKILSGDA